MRIAEPAKIVDEDGTHNLGMPPPEREHALLEGRTDLRLHALLVLLLPVDVVAETLLVVADVLSLAVRHLAVFPRLLALLLDRLLLILETVRLLGRDLPALLAPLDAVLLLLLPLLDALGETGGRAGHEQGASDHENRSFHLNLLTDGYHVWGWVPSPLALSASAPARSDRTRRARRARSG